MAYFTGKVTNEGVYRLNERVYVINGKIICFEPTLYDVNNPADMERLMNFVNILYTEEGPRRRYGNESVCVLHDISHDGIRQFNPDVLYPDLFSGEDKSCIEKAIGDLYGV